MTVRQLIARHRNRTLLATALAMVVAGSAAAADNDNNGEEPNIVPPPPPEELRQGEMPEPSVTIVERPWATIEEYSVNGQVYAVKVEPSVGPAYYLYDSNGDGSLETRRGVLGEVPETPQWKILTW